jgi:hypothetical protein
VLLGNGDGSFQDAQAYAVFSSPASVAIADLDGDTVPDLVTANSIPSGIGLVFVLLGNGDGSFQATGAFAAGNRPRDVAVADLDGDTVPDLVTANGDTDDVSVLLGNGDGSFQLAQNFAAGVLPVSVAVADVDGDTAPDLVTANSAGVDVSVLLGHGDGSFQGAVSFAARGPNTSGNYYEAGPLSVAAADLNGDTLLDLVIANGGSDDAGVYLNQSPPPILAVEIDIKPSSDPNPINPFSRGVVPVAILGSDSFDVADVDVTTLVFGPDGATPIFDLANPLVYWLSHWDVNGDDRMDLLSSYRIAETGIALGDTEACLAAETIDGVGFEGCDAVTTVMPPWSCGLSAELALLLPPLMWLWRRRQRRS